MFVVIAHLLILNNDVNDICIVYTSPEKSTQLIEYYWDCIPVIGLRPENVHTRNGLGANLICKGTYIFSFGKIRLCTETICGVPFGVLILYPLLRFLPYLFTNAAAFVLSYTSFIMENTVIPFSALISSAAKSEIDFV